MRKVYHYRVVRLALLLLVAAPAFVAVGIRLLVLRPDSVTIWLVSVPCILFFGGTFLLGLVNLPRMVRDSTALILTPEAMTLRHPGREEQTQIQWTEIVGFTERYIKGQHFVIPQLRTPAPRIAREHNPLWRSVMKLNTLYDGSPYSISTNSLRCDPDELVTTLVAYLEKYGSPASETEGRL
ncbi:STM3941 family protein [Alistipes sp.]|uniref:STM3941 family protein n=1 Tax=Alistipes sp. TaxID=1872444 RepID=UPI003AEFBA6A